MFPYFYPSKHFLPGIYPFIFALLLFLIAICIYICLYNYYVDIVYNYLDSWIIAFCKMATEKRNGIFTLLYLIRASAPSVQKKSNISLPALQFLGIISQVRNKLSYVRIVCFLKVYLGNDREQPICRHMWAWFDHWVNLQDHLVTCTTTLPISLPHKIPKSCPVSSALIKNLLRKCMRPSCEISCPKHFYVCIFFVEKTLDVKDF